MSQLEELVKEGEKVRHSCFHNSEYGGYLNGEAYEMWIAKCTIYLEQKSFPQSQVDKFKTAASSAVGNSVSYYEQMIGILKAILDMKLDTVQSIEHPHDFKDKPKLFISHSSKDKEVCNKLVDLLHDIGVQTHDIFYSSLEEHGVPLGDDFLDYIRERFNNNVFVIFVLSRDFYESKICLAEMGASWVKSAEYLPILIPPINYQDMEGVIRPTKNSMLINDEKKLDSLKTKIESIFNIWPVMDFQRWQRKRDEYIEAINVFIEGNRQNDFDVHIVEFLDTHVKNSRVKLRMKNNTRRVVKPAEIEIYAIDEENNEIREVFDDYLITSIILKPFEETVLYLDLTLNNQNFKKRKIKNLSTRNEWDDLS